MLEDRFEPGGRRFESVRARFSHRVTSRRVAYIFDSKHIHSLTNRVRLPTFADLIRLADQDDSSRYDMASLGPAAIIKLTVRELDLATQVLLRALPRKS